MRKTVLITGCSSGFGLLTAIKFHQEDWKVVGLVRSISQELKWKLPREIELIELDVTHSTRIPKVIAEVVEKHGKIDVLVNNAGVGSFGLFEQHDEKTMQYLFDVNVFGLMNMTKAVLPFMRQKQSGMIVNVSSIRGVEGCPMKSIYCATKFAVQGFSESLAAEVRQWNIQVKTVLPGAYNTGFHNNSFNHTSTGSTELQKYSQRLLNTFKRKRIHQFDVHYGEPNPNEVAFKIFEIATDSSSIHNRIREEEKELLSS